MGSSALFKTISDTYRDLLYTRSFFSVLEMNVKQFCQAAGESGCPTMLVFIREFLNLKSAGNKKLSQDIYMVGRTLYGAFAPKADVNRFTLLELLELTRSEFNELFYYWYHRMTRTRDIIDDATEFLRTDNIEIIEFMYTRGFSIPLWIAQDMVEGYGSRTVMRALDEIYHRIK